MTDKRTPRTVWWVADCGYTHVADDPVTITSHCPDGIHTPPDPLRALLDALEAETKLPPKPTQYRRGWADAHARAAGLVRMSRFATTMKREL